MTILVYAFNTAMGWCAVSGTDGRIAELRLPVSSRELALLEAREGNGTQYVETDYDFSGQADSIAEYFTGKSVKFDCDLDLSKGSDFDRRVWSAVRDISYGEVVSYGDVAVSVGVPGGARAVGQSLGRNPVPVIVPCHRIVRANGELGGFGCGVDWKVRLLNLEHIQPPYRRRDGES